VKTTERAFARGSAQLVLKTTLLLLYTIVARTHMYTHAAKVWDFSIVQGHFLSPRAKP
jgi:hypothetical protein